MFPDDFERTLNIRGKNIPKRVKIAAEVLRQRESDGELIIEIIEGTYRLTRLTCIVLSACRHLHKSSVMVHGHKTSTVPGKDKTFAAPVSALVIKVRLPPFIVGKSPLQILELVATNA